MRLPAARHWGIEMPVRPLSGGIRHRVFRTLGRTARPEPHYVFKTTTRSEAAMRWLLPVLKAADLAGLSVPVPLPSLRGRLVEGGWMCEPLIPGRPLAPDEMTRLAAPLARFHARTTALPQRPGYSSAVDLIERDRGGDVDLAAMSDDIASLCREAWAALLGAPKGIVHGALSPANALLARDGRPALLDWDMCRRDALVFDRLALAPQHVGLEAKRAVQAFNVAALWHIEPERALDLADDLRSGQGGPA